MLTCCPRSAFAGHRKSSDAGSLVCCQGGSFLGFAVPSGVFSQLGCTVAGCVQAWLNPRRPPLAPQAGCAGNLPVPQTVEHASKITYCVRSRGGPPGGPPGRYPPGGPPPHGGPARGRSPGRYSPARYSPGRYSPRATSGSPARSERSGSPAHKRRRSRCARARPKQADTIPGACLVFIDGSVAKEGDTPARPADGVFYLFLAFFLGVFVLQARAPPRAVPAHRCLMSSWLLMTALCTTANAPAVCTAFQTRSYKQVQAVFAAVLHRLSVSEES